VTQAGGSRPARRAALLVAGAAIGLLLTGPAGAPASWSAPRALPALGTSLADVAINDRGDAAVVWTGGSPITVNVTLLPAAGGSATHRLWRTRNGERSDSVSVALDQRGAVTVAWISGVSSTGHDVLRAAHGALMGRWSSPQVVSATMASSADLAVAPDRTVLLVWTNGPMDRRGSTGVAWRTPPHRFGERRMLRRPAAVWTPYIPLGPATAAFDARGTAYVSGGCDGSVRIARSRRRRFGAPVAAAPGRVLSLSLSVSGAGSGLVSWIDSRCTGDVGGEGSPRGSVWARAMRSGAFAAPVAVSPQPDQLGTRAIAIPGDGGVVTWPIFGVEPPSGVSFDAAGMPGMAGPTPDGLSPQAADGAGDLLLSGATGTLIVRPARGGAYEPGPPGAGVVATSGRGFAVVWNPEPAGDLGARLRLSMWRP
jgi:hypothetical protein